MIQRAVKYLTFVVLCVMLTQCDGSSDRNKDGDRAERDTTTSEVSSTNKARIITLPTPMQVPALLKNTRSSYSTSAHLPIITDEKSYYKSGILFGIYMSDLAYSASFAHQQASLNYFRICKKLGDDLGLGVRITEKYVDRFERNVSRPDSLGRIVLEMYDLGHKVLIDQDKEGLGFLMVMGCYMEGMNLIMRQARDHDLILFVHLLHQQKNYGNNLTSMLDQYEIPAEIQEEVGHFRSIVSLLNETDIPTVYELKTGTRTIAGLKEENLQAINEHLTAFRRSILI